MELTDYIYCIEYGLVSEVKFPSSPIECAVSLVCLGLTHGDGDATIQVCSFKS